MAKIKKQNLAFDFDDVLCEVTKAFLKFHKKQYGYTIPYHESGVALYGNLGITSREEDARWDVFFHDAEYAYPKPVKNLRKDLIVLKKEYSLMLLTARDPRWHFQIKNWIEKYLPDMFEKIVFAHTKKGKRQKGMLCKKYKTVALVEDEPEHIRSCIKHKMPVIIFDRPWNKEMSEKILRVSSAAGVKKLFTRK